ncbi:MAG: hypothetical protein M3Z23_08650 [Acidobacteriota bacterium]|nr:hypothetical protein [Acidobacteriota bacterium]
MSIGSTRFEKRLFTGLVCLATLAATPGSAQTTAPSAKLQFLQTIPIPGWDTNAAGFDLFAFNPETRILYVADRTNHGIDAIDTRTNSFVGSLTVPNNASPNGVLVVPELQQMVVTDGGKNVLVYDLRLPGMGPDIYAVPGITGGTDALDYDPLNRRVYVINGNAPYMMTGIDLITKTVASQLALPGSPELMRFNPVDGLIYQVITDGDNKNAGAGVAVFDPVSNTLKPTFLTPDCVPHGIDIDPVSNTAILGCGGAQAQVLMDLKTGAVLKSFPDVTGTDLLLYNPNNRRFYTASSSNKSTTTGCPADGPTNPNYPVLGVFDALSSSTGRLVGIACSGRGAHGLGIDPIQNLIYVGATQYPADPADRSTGSTGVLVYYDPAPAAQNLTTNTRAMLTGLGGNGAGGMVNIRTIGRTLRLDANLQSVSGQTALINVTTTVGNEVIPCSIDYKSGNAVCNGTLVGDPMINGVALLAIDGAPAAQGKISAMPGPVPPVPAR